MSRVLLVGEMNPYGADPRYALYDEPASSAGGRMRRLVCGLHSRTYLRLGRANLCTGKWSAPAARDRSGAMLSDNLDVVFVLLGRKVADAFGFWNPGRVFDPFTQVPKPVGGHGYVALPHPSGLCRVWNEPGAFERARSLLRDACPDVPWGESET